MKIINRLVYRILNLLRLDYEKYQDLKLPLSQFRYCGERSKDNPYYLKSAHEEVQKIIKYGDLDDQSAILDVGCGQGRLPIGIMTLSKRFSYTGVDIDKRSVQWCKRYLKSKNPAFEFSLLDIYNERYNRNGAPLDENFRFSFEDNRFDAIYLYSVFSHMIPPEINYYLREFKRILKPSGTVIFTTFVEENVPDFEENPANYKREWEGPLHCVRYNKSYLKNLAHNEGFEFKEFEYATADDGQSVVILNVKPNQVVLANNLEKEVSKI